MPIVRLLIVDDQPLVRKGLLMGLSLEDDFNIVGEAENGQLALEAVEKLRPDIILMDLEMPEMDGITASNVIQSRFPGSHIIILSMHGSKEVQSRALAAGASAFIEKKEGLEILVGEIRRIARQSFTGSLPE